MFGKFLVTLAVIVLAIIAVKQRNSRPANNQNPSANGSATTANAAKAATPQTSDIRIAAYLFLILMIGTGTVLYVMGWRDRHTVLTVNLYAVGSESPASYQVYKYQLQSRSFTTLDGTVITVADSERMEVLGLD